jgi:hypothetical protein
MAYVEGLEVVAESTGASDHIHLGGGRYVLHMTSSGWGEATLQASSGKADQWSDVSLPNDEATATKNTSVEVPGNTSYRINVASAPNSIRLEAAPID